RDCRPTRLRWRRTVRQDATPTVTVSPWPTSAWCRRSSTRSASTARWTAIRGPWPCSTPAWPCPPSRQRSPSTSRTRPTEGQPLPRLRRRYRHDRQARVGKVEGAQGEVEVGADEVGVLVDRLGWHPKQRA